MVTQWYCQLMGSELGPFMSKQLLEMEAIKGSTKQLPPPEGFTVPEKRLVPSFFLQRNQSPSSAVVPLVSWWFLDPH
jgi:hypothetical protein